MNCARRSGLVPLLLAALAAMATAQSRPVKAEEGGSGDPRAILFRMSVSARKMGYEGRKVIIDLSREVPDITRYQVVHVMPDLERKDYPELGRTIIRKDGWLWQYYSKEDLIIKKKAPSMDEWDVLQEENLELVLRNYYVHLSQGSPILGRRSLLVHLDPLEKGSRPSRKVWVDAEKGLPLRGEVYGVDGNLYLISHFERIKYGVPPRAGTFEIKAPRARVVEPRRGAEESRLKGQEVQARGLYRPVRLPSGFVVKGVRATRGDGALEYQEFFTDGLSALSLFQGEGERPQELHGSRSVAVKVRDGPARYYEFGLLRIVRWNEGGRHFVLVGELAAEEMLRVAGSVEDSLSGRKIKR